MRSIVLPGFRKMLERLPLEIQQDARENFQKWKQDPRLVGWKRLSGMRADLYSVQIGNRHRAIGVVDKGSNAIVWMFIGSHETYNNWIEIHRKQPSAHWTEDKKIQHLIGARRAEKEQRAPRKARAPD